MKIVSFNFDDKLCRKFIDLSWKVNKKNSQWIPPFKRKLTKQLSYDNEFFKYGTIKNFLAFENNAVVGRISAIVNTKATEKNQSIGFLGFFECIEDYSITSSLLEEAVKYFHKQGIKIIRGPINFSTWHTYRFMTKGFEQSPFFLEPFNPTYYPHYFEKYGFKKAMGYCSNLLETPDHQIQIAEEKSERFLASGYTIRHIDMSQLQQELQLLYELSTQSFADAWGFTEISFSEFSNLYDGFHMLIEPEFVLFAYDSRKKPVGFVFAMPNYAEPIRRMNGKTNILAKLKFLQARHKVDTFMVKTIGIIPEARQHGIGSILLGQVHKIAKKRGYSKVIYALMRSNNVVIRKMSDRGGNVFKEYAVYELKLQ